MKSQSGPARHEEILVRARRPFPHKPIRTLEALYLASALAARAAVLELAILSLDSSIQRTSIGPEFEVRCSSPGGAKGGTRRSAVQIRPPATRCDQDGTRVKTRVPSCLHDANVLFAAAISPSGRSAALFLLAAQGRCELLVSPHAVAEARRNLEVRYPEALHRFRRLLRIAAVVPEATQSGVASARRRGLPEEDAPILAAAIAAGAHVLVTGDRIHFGHLFGRTVGGVRVLGLADTLESLLRPRRRD